MSQQDIITRSDISNLLVSGAFLREGSCVHLMAGPFEEVKNGEISDISVCCPTFYEVQNLSFLRPTRFWTVDVGALLAKLQGYIEEFSVKVGPLHWIEPSRKDFDLAFARIQNLISQGQIDKAVPAVFARTETKISFGLKALWWHSLLRASENLFPYGFWIGDEGMIGATPEVLFSLEGLSLQTMALAGTLAKAQGSAKDLERSTKDLREHRFVVEDIAHVLGPLGRLQVGPTQVMELPTLYHLRTDFQLELSSAADVADLIRRLHPTAALGVFPRVFGWQWMRDLPGQEGRGRFGAPFSFCLSKSRALSVVGIRQIQWQGDSLRLGSGCGVVKESDPESEWEELKRKRTSVLSMLGIS